MTTTPPPEQPKIPDLPKEVTPDTLNKFTADAERFDKAELAMSNAAADASETGKHKSSILDSLPRAKMEIKVAKFMAKVLTKQARWKQFRFGFMVGPLTFIVGLLVFVAGIIAIPAPGPGWLIVFMGLGILSIEVPRARALVLLTARFFDRTETWYRGLPGPWRVVVTALTTAVIFAVFFAIYHFMGPSSWPLTRTRTS